MQLLMEKNRSPYDDEHKDTANGGNYIHRPGP